MEKNLIIDMKKIIQKFMYRKKCKSFIILNDKKEILKYDSSHNHPEKEYNVSLSIMKHKILKMELKKSSIPYGIKIKSLYNKISKEMRFILKLFREYNDDIFVDGTFFIAPKFSYQILITRTYAKELDSFYTTSFAILQNKDQEIYKIFKKLKKKKNANTCNNNIIIAESIVI
ncbi:hypothetical protein U3516DRAFT_792005 [Neocallimastix sp. 'constans']